MGLTWQYSALVTLPPAQLWGYEEGWKDIASRPVGLEFTARQFARSGFGLLQMHLFFYTVLDHLAYQRCHMTIRFINRLLTDLFTNEEVLKKVGQNENRQMLKLYLAKEASTYRSCFETWRLSSWNYRRPDVKPISKPIRWRRRAEQKMVDTL